MTLRRVLTASDPEWDHAPVDAPRTFRGGGWRKSGLRATVVALAAVALLVGALGAVVALSVVFAASGPVTGAMLDFLVTLPISLGPEFAFQLAASVLGVALLVGAGGATLSVRSHLAK